MVTNIWIILTKLWALFFGALFELMEAFEHTFRTAVRGYRVYKNTWTPTIREELVCPQERAHIYMISMQQLCMEMEAAYLLVGVVTETAH